MQSKITKGFLKAFLNGFFHLLTCFALLMSGMGGLSTPQGLGQDWARWRGPTGNGIAAENERPPIQWNEKESQNIVWKVPLPGRGHASPLVVGDKIILATAEKEKASQSVICLDRATGAQVWNTLVHQGSIDYPIHPNNSYASSTLATNGEGIFAVFYNRDAIFLTKLDFEGNIAWEQRVGTYQDQYRYGYAATPSLYQSTVIVTSVNRADSVIVAFDIESGQERWRTKMDVETNYATSVIANIQGTDQLIYSGTNKVSGFDPNNGKLLWSVPAKWLVTCATLVWDDERVFASGGFPAPQTLAISLADWNGSAGSPYNPPSIWENNQKSYEQSLLLYQGHVYTHADSGVVFCWRASDGREMWKARFTPRGRVGQSASPVVANDHIYITAENGETLVIQANPDRMVEVARNQIGDEMFASLAICGNQIFARAATYPAGNRRQRQEWLYCIGETSAPSPSATRPAQ